MQPIQQPPPGSNLIEAEIQHNIPVKSYATEGKNPIAALKQFVEHDDKKDEGLDQVLNDVNQSVKESDNKTHKGSVFSFLKKHKSEKPAQPQIQEQLSPHTQSVQQTPAEQPTTQVSKEKPKNSKPIFVAAIAIIVAGGLSAAAFYAFAYTKGSNSKTAASSSTERGKFQVNPGRFKGLLYKSRLKS
jgi:hypothetical protein